MEPAPAPKGMAAAPLRVAPTTLDSLNARRLEPVAIRAAPLWSQNAARGEKSCRTAPIGREIARHKIAPTRVDSSRRNESYVKYVRILHFELQTPESRCDPFVVGLDAGRSPAAIAFRARLRQDRHSAKGRQEDPQGAVGTRAHQRSAELGVVADGLES
jgi:hypothetical protein